jgi:hypothetical protein
VDVEAVENLVGARVVQKVGEFELCFDDRLVELKKSINVYCVERIEGDLLFLRYPAWQEPVCRDTRIRVFKSPRILPIKRGGGTPNFRWAFSTRSIPERLFRV